MSIIRTPSIKFIVHLRWPVRDAASAVLSPTVIERLAPYLTRHAETRNILVYAIGGGADHLHLLLDLPPTLSLEQVKDDLQRASAQFLRVALKQTEFAWSEDGLYFATISPEEVDEFAGYISDNLVRHATGDIVPEWEWDGWDPLGEDLDDEDGDLPGWLRDALGP